jgi:rod shape-determining protein MreC
MNSQYFDFNFIPANVINNSINNVNNYLLIDKGRKNGIKKDMGVICENGVVGKVVNVTENYASVISMLHPYTIISARFTDNQHIANVSWDNLDYRFGTVNDIPLHLVLEKGDTLVTSGFSNIYPAGIMIGTIEEMIESKSKDFSTAKIRFSTNFSALRDVFVIENLNQTEIDSLTLTQR